MDLVINFIKGNYTWFFSGLGVFILTLVVTFFVKKGGNKNVIKGKSSGLQAQGDLNINYKEK